MRLQALTTVILITLVYAKKRHHHESDEEEEDITTTDNVMDRLALNLAGAFVKSVLPEIEQPSIPLISSETRRASQPENIFDQTQIGRSGAYSSILNDDDFSPWSHETNRASFGMGGTPIIAFPRSQPTSPLYEQIPFTHTYPQHSFGSASSPDLASSPSSRGIEALNEAHKDRYLAELHRHQHELAQHAAKQMRYLDEQRRFQKAFLDRQAGIALAMQQQQQQQQQQELIQQRINGIAQQRARTARTLTNDRRRHRTSEQPEQTQQLHLREGRKTAKRKPLRSTAKQTPHQIPPVLQNDDDNANDENLRRFFKENYSVDIPNDVNGATLTEEERDALQELKQHLIGEINSERGDDEQFATNSERSSNSDRYGSSQSSKAIKGNFELICDKCVPVEMEKLQGAWTQIYGNPTALRRTYSTVLTLKSIILKRGTTTTNLTLKKASCVGFDIGKPRNGTASMNLAFRDDSSSHELHQMSGVIGANEDGSMRMELTNTDISVCLVMAGPVEKERYEYIVFTETDGSERCRVYHIYARNADEFNKTHYDIIARFMKDVFTSTKSSLKPA